jgi:hypothetical protein
MRLVQCHGGSIASGAARPRVIRSLFPDRGLDRMLRLEERLQRKLTQVAQTSVSRERRFQRPPGSRSRPELVPASSSEQPRFLPSSSDVGRAPTGALRRYEVVHHRVRRVHPA